MPCMNRVHRDQKYVGPLFSSQEGKALLVLDMPCMKGFHRQIGVGTLIGSQEERALLVLLTKRLSTAISFPRSVQAFV